MWVGWRRRGDGSVLCLPRACCLPSNCGFLSFFLEISNKRYVQRINGFLDFKKIYNGVTLLMHTSAVATLS